ncbi:MAG TPA: isoleucine--tRNA ligase [Amaricoccus sp.]|uniref:isoleucine--tRNA ligase n=1 Tax=Amaricoccus sp. TaxID=1872485 RepID=UPI002CBE5334|nr:isoleucine--tRNA ligase [Amaricoccus sp.]HMQ94838.1 isoleucine--tRNA ligase [Amaricoccus sp.]HMR52192.1 isoleucine--tRNA ligase [Amaricoccus sp.]HMR59521.1 isoleucine--tRNA ligase [Amaricoccus sp.]HMT99044.1 isoleucine--tRNA ligase [Amaricoccus sp.]
MCAETTTDLPDYKDTLFLPKTAFPMRAGLPQREPEWLARWERIGVYDRLRETGAGREAFVLHDGPPYANGHLHIGHALNKILKDFVVRSQQMMGKDSRYVPGWDCHGLPIEWKIEEQYRAKGRNKDEVPVNELRAECRRFAESWVDIQREEFKRLGVSGNWADPYLTMAFDAEAVIAEEFMKFVMNGSLYLGSKPVMWSPVEKTALAEAEVEYRDHQSHTIWVKFPVVKSNIALSRAVAEGESFEEGNKELHKLLKEQTELNELLEQANVIIWTTTPWTIPSNRAVAFGYDISYGLYRVLDVPPANWAKSGDLYLLADKLAPEVFKAARAQYERVRDVPSGLQELEQVTLAHPLRGALAANGEWDFDVPMLLGGHVTDDSGTGFVHTAPSHGADDYALGVKHGLPMTYNVLEDSSFRADLPLFGGALIFDHKGKEKDANPRVIEALAAAGALIARGRLTHSYPHSWRSKAPVIYRNTPQWFVAIDKPLEDGMDEFGTTIRERALTSIDRLVTWTPQSGRNRLYSMIEVRPDWVLSRQRAWGVPLTCFVKRQADGGVEILRDAAVNARIAETFRAEGADAWFREDAAARFLGNDHDPAEWEKVTDILDVWFDSGSTHAFVLRDRADGLWPASLYLEGTDQHRGWFHSSMLQACGTMGRAPYEGVLTHGFTLDERGMKMSKSLGNTVAPEDVVRQYGADILRLWVAQADYTADQRIGPEILKGSADAYRRLRNTMRFLLGALEGFDEAERLEPDAMPELERWVLHRLAELDGIVRAGYAAYDFQHVFHHLFQFCTVDLSSVYFDIRKDALYCDAAASPRRRAARTVLDLLHRRLTTWLAPILVFTMEEVWLERFPGDRSSVHLMDFPATPATWRDPALAAKWEVIRRARRVVTGALEVERREKRIGASLEAAPLVHVADGDIRALLAGVPFADICIVSDLRLSDAEAPAGAFTLDDVPGIAVIFAPAEGDKCARCWRILPDVGSHRHAQVCERCDEALG